ncbi:MAG: hypothetical protein FJW30_30175, partial [Acidobacteria bacterium]|nr:hypothetical protein [Acidobacteriota bacterium]
MLRLLIAGLHHHVIEKRRKCPEKSCRGPPARPIFLPTLWRKGPISRELRIAQLEERLRLLRIAKYGPRGENLSATQLAMFEQEISATL